MKDFVIKAWGYIKRFYYWFTGLWTIRYTIHVSFDNQWGNGDDQVYTHVRKIIKSNFGN